MDVHPFFHEQLAHDRRSRLQREADIGRLTRSTKLTSTNRLRVRPLEPGDIDAMAALYGGLSPRSRTLRFMSPIHKVPAAVLEHLADIDHDGHEALGAFKGGTLMASAHWFRLEHRASFAEVGTEVTDDYQRRGVGSRLLRLLGSRARAVGIRQFGATVLAENAGALALIRATGWPVTSEADGPQLTVATTLADNRRRRR
jgi:GNAT superfamily N-acetyltransferase